MNFDIVLKYVILLICIFMSLLPRRRTILEEQTVFQPVKLLLTFCAPEDSSLLSKYQATTLHSQPHVYNSFPPILSDLLAVQQTVTLSFKPDFSECCLLFRYLKVFREILMSHTFDTYRYRFMSPDLII
jgi:hypothetical protein